MTEAVVLDRLGLQLGGRAILRDVSLAIGRGEFVGVLGSNGAGKTTLMRALLGLVRPSAGSIRILGRPAERGNIAIGYMPQIRATLGAVRVSGWDFVASAARGERWGLPLLGAEARRQVDGVLDMVGARDLARRPLNELSGGERQRLLMAQALLGRPEILLLDEPLASLDINHQHAVVSLVKELQRDHGLTVLFTAHEINPLIGVIDRVLYLGGGDAALGGVDEVITGPTLSRLYGAPIDVVRVDGRIFVMAGAHSLERDCHGHDHGHGHDLGGGRGHGPYVRAQAAGPRGEGRSHV
ncbi:zinc/manganese transport system ATP-binding protein [Faunimonas pinastri]|uniref:Zinc/manganese transport system ATP-binding protein n=1 Tax=Faunimonas pinastri TaxID=1855383 RepID=A0A1H9AG85_9HYPH|nr:ABC transporter ATP-binding protein [Faunimonas pinastri]SEP75792.1 zinc/manganese transport system ATP-binding protein [Faunimonas pinastri]